MRSPIEIMVDRACGIPDDVTWIKPTGPTMRCRKCKQEKKVSTHYSDPDGTVVIEFLCPECAPDGFDDLTYLDASGKALVP